MAKHKDMQAALFRAIAQVGSINKTAKKLGLTRQAVGAWDICPLKHVLAVEKASGVSRYELRPDIFGTAP